MSQMNLGLRLLSLAMNCRNQISEKLMNFFVNFGTAPTQQTGRMNLQQFRKQLVAEVNASRLVKMYVVGDYIILDTQDHMTIFLPRTKDTDDKKSMILSNDAADLFRVAIAFDGDKAPNDELVPLVERLLQEGSKDG